MSSTLDPFDEISTLFFGQPGGQGDLEPAVEEFFFPRRLKGDTWLNLREKAFPAFLDIVCDLATERQRILCINQWIYHTCFQDHVTSSNELPTRSEDTFGLKDRFVSILSTLYDRARANGGLVTSDCINTVLQSKLPRLVTHMRQKFPEGNTFHSGHLNFARLASNLSYMEV